MSVSSLQHSCLKKIAQDIAFWCPSGDDYSLNSYLYVLGPFVHLGSRQIQELISILAKKKSLKASHMHSLLHCGLTYLDLSPCRYLVSDILIEMVSKRCKKLSHLSLANCSRISSRLLQELPTSLRNLLSIDLSRCTSCDDNVLISLNKHCKHLQVLKVDSCKKVTDYGLAALNSGSNLVEINLSATSVSPEGVFILLKNHPYLQSLSLSMCRTVAKPRITSRAEQYFDDIFLSLDVTRLTYLDLSYSLASDRSIAVVSKICPDISSLMINGLGSTECLEHINKLQHLTHFKVDGLTTAHRNELQRFLEEHGSCLETLYFQGALNISTGMIGNYCPNLRSLSLAGSENVIATLSQDGSNGLTLMEACPYLRFLDLRHCSFSTMESNKHCSAIFSKSMSSLEELYLADVNLAFEDLKLYIESPCFSNLRILDISKNELVFRDLVVKIVQCCKHLEHLNVCDCWHVKKSDIEDVKTKFGRQTEIIWS